MLENSYIFDQQCFCTHIFAKLSYIRRNFAISLCTYLYICPHFNKFVFTAYAIVYLDNLCTSPDDARFRSNCILGDKKKI
jgi:hypothetical protein